MAQGVDGSVVTLQSGQTAVQPGTNMNVAGLGNVILEVTSSGSGPAWAGTVVPQGTTDGINWNGLPAINLTTGAVVMPGGGIQTPGSYLVPCSGQTLVRANSTAISAGQVSVVAIGTISPGSMALDAVIPAGKTKIRNLASTTLVKGTPGVLSGLVIVNNQGATAWIQVFDLAVASVSLGTTTPDLEFQVAANSELIPQFPSQGIAFNVAISIASTQSETGAALSAAGVHVFPLFA